MEEGHDYVGSVRKNRQDTWFRAMLRALNNFLRAKMTA